MKCELHTFTYNEEFMLPNLVKWYRTRIPEIRIIVHDNESTDKTRDIAHELGCEVITFSTNGHLKNKKLRELKNSVWKNSAADFVIVADVDEMLDIDEEFLSHTDATVIRGVGINMVGDSRDLTKVNHGALSSNYDKMLCFSPKFISKMNYSPGAHYASPKGVVRIAHAPLFHYKWISPEYVKFRTRLVHPRRSRQDKIHGYGIHYEMTDATIEKKHKEWSARSVPIAPEWS